MSGEMIRILCSASPDVAGHQREDGADGVRGLGGHPDGQLAVDLVEVGHAAARLDRGDVDARDVDVLLDGDLGLGEGALGAVPVAPLPVPDVVVLLVLLVGAQHRGAGLERLVRVDDDRQRLVVDLDACDAVGGQRSGSVARTAATSWAWYITFSTGSTIWVSDIRVGIQCRLYLARSWPVMTASTPGMASAFDVSIFLIFAWA